MFHISTPDWMYSDPWQIPLAKRLSDLKRKQRRVAYFYHNPDNSTFRYRIYNMMQVLNQSDLNISASYFHLADGDAIWEFVDCCDCLVICRLQYSTLVERVIDRARMRGIEVLFDTDDLVFDVRYIPLVMDSLNQDLGPSGPWDSWFAYIGRIGATMQLCDRYIVTTESLASRAQDFGGKPAAVVPNFLNQEQMTFSDRLFAGKSQCGFRSDGRIHIGYFSGSPTHEKDFALVADTLARMMDRDRRLHLTLVGYLNPGPVLDRHAGRIVRHPFTDFINLQKLIATTEINVAPLQDNAFTNCKSELKYFEAAVVGAVTVATPTVTFRKVIEDGSNGYLAPAHLWRDKVGEAIEQVAEGGRAFRELLARARQHAKRNYGWNEMAGVIRDALFPGEIRARLRDVQDKQSVALEAGMNRGKVMAHQKKKLLLSSSVK